VTTAPRSKQSLLIVTLVVIVLIAVPLLLCGFVAVRNFLTFGVKSKQAEVKTNLKAAWIAEKVWFDEHQRYSESLEEVGFLPERNNRYRYMLALDGGVLVQGARPDGGWHGSIAVDERMAPRLSDATVVSAIPASLRAEVGVRGTCPGACRITIVAAGDIDGDPTVDVWSISTEARVIGGEPVPAGTPWKHVDDVTE
jgi:type IV pilus assembly protein PilA